MPGANRTTTVREIRDLALTAETRLVAGEAGLDHHVQWVTGLHATYPLFPDLDRGHLAIGSPEVARRLDAQLTLSYLIRELAHIEAAGLIVDELPDAEALALANELQLPLFVVPDGTDLRLLEREALRALLDREGHVARRAEEWRETYQALLSKGGAGAVIEHLALEFGVGARLLDSCGTLLAQAGQVDSPVDGSRAQVFPVAITARTLGTLHIVTHGDVSPLLPVAANQAAQICAIELIQASVRRETEDQLSVDLVAELLSNTSDMEAALARLSRQGYDLTPGRRHAAIAVPAAPDTAAISSSAISDLESDLRFAGRRDGICTLVLGYHDVSLCLLSVPPSVSEQKLRNWLTQALPSHSGPVCRLAVSRLVPESSGLAMAVQQALAVQSMGRRMRDWSGPLYYADMGLYRLILGLRDQAEVRRFYSDTLGRLVEYDREHNSELVPTLRAYFEQNANASETARKMYVHRNTLSYRLQRIAEIVGLDLDDPDTRLALAVALRIHYLGP
jgi:purine catabolism regulator